MAGVRALEPLVVGRDRRGARGRHGRRSGATSSATASCAGSGPRRASSTSRRRPSSTPSGTSSRSGPGKPLWQLLVDMSPEEIVDLVDFRYMTDALTPDEALGDARAALPGRADREAELRRDGYPAYTTSVGWLGYDDDKIRRLCREALADGWTRFKLKVGADVEDDVRRMRIVREEIGPDRHARGRRQPALGRRRGHRVDGPAGAVRPVLDRGADEPGRHPRPRHDRPRRRARSGSRPASTSTTGSCSSSSSRPSAIGICQIDACRLGGVNEVIAVLLLAAKFGVPVCPHAGGVGLCELVQHLVGVRLHRGQRHARRPDDRVRRPSPRALPRPGRRRGRALPAADPAGYSAEMRPASLARYRYPDGAEWQES